MSYRRLLITCFLLVYFTHPVSADFELKLNQGVAAYLKKDYQAAVNFLKLALEENPDSATANHILGLSLSRLEKYDEAITYLEKTKELDPNIRGIYLDLGTAYLKGDDLKMAESEFKEAVRQEPENGLAYYNLGYTQFQLGNFEEAITALDKAANLDPELATQARFYAGLSRYKLTDYQASISDFQSARELGLGTDFAIASEEYLDLISRLNKKYYGTVSSGVQYDTNVVLDPDGVEIISDQSAARAIFYLNLGYKPYLKPDAVIGGDYTGYFSFNHDLEDFNVQSHLFRIYGEKTVSVRKRPTAFYLEYFYNIIFVGGSPADNLFSQSNSVRPKVTVQWSSLTQTELSYQFRYDNFDNFPERDAANNNLTLAQLFRLCDGKLFLRPGINVAINSAKDITGRRNFDYFSPEVFLETVSFLPHGITVLTNTYYFNADYYNDPFDRVDNQIGVRAVVSKKLYKVLSLDLSYQYIKNFSSSDFPGPEPFKYSTNIFSAVLSARF
ncbi:MAG TPA: tetratricopeptide repeat protein [Thermodesulfobacteriota bacterium]|nr:tetratricopeptide repeat protein [Thermodesulfobacteriota bacterium]